MAKRIAFITENFLGSTLPLIRQLCKREYNIDLYIYRREIHEPEACELDYKAEHYGINTIPRHLYSGILDYVGSDNLNVFTFSQIKPFASVPVVRNIVSLIMAYQAHKAAKYINAQGYDAINMIGNYSMPYMRHLLRYLKGNVIMSLHEVWDHSQPSTKPSVLLSEAIRNKYKIHVFSANSRKDISQIEGIDMSLVHVNPFGIFESFASLPEGELEVSLPEKYILFFGYILPYKGLSVLHQAIKLIGKELGEYKIVIAGRGNDPVLEEIKNDDRYVLISRFIKSRELVTLIGHAYMTVCPYLSISQSGIPQTAFAFGTPIISSDIGAFKDIVTPEFGLRFPAGDSKVLAEQIRQMLAHPDKRDVMYQNIRRFEQLRPEYDWSNICDNYLTIVSK